VTVNDSAEGLFRRRCVFLPPKLPPTAQKQQSRRRYAANGFAFVPQTLPCPRTSHGIGRVVEPAGDVIAFVPTFRSAAEGRPVQPAKHNAIKRAWL
jgi:hypothetical protein